MDKTIKKLGFGLMRLPLKNSKIDMEETLLMLDAFIGNGYSYFDSAPGYMNCASEKIFGELTHNRYNRDEMIVATKLPAWDRRFIYSSESAEKVFNNSLRDMKIDYFDNYLFHNMGEERNFFFEKYNLWKFVIDKKEQGYIRNFGISFHDKADKLDELLCDHKEIDFVQLQVNCLDWTNPFVEAKKCVHIAKKHSKPILIMEPLKGGILANPNAMLLNIINKRNEDPIKFSFDFVNSIENCDVILSGMSSLSQVKKT